jgi:phenylacetyl-CoA:acceptor oxidoreductase subunit 2
MTMTATTVSQRQRHWDLRAAGNFIGGGLGTGTVIATALAAAVAGGPVRLPMAVGLACILVGLSLVLMEIGKPFRALHVFFNPNTSWMTRESMVALPLLPLIAVAVLFARLDATVIAALVAVAFLYCQARILRASKGIPAWRQAEIVPFIIATGLAEGGGLYLAIGGRPMVAILFALAAAIAREVTWRFYSRGLAATGVPAQVTAPLTSPMVAAVRVLQVLGLVLVAAALVGGGAATALAVSGGVLAAVTGGAIKAVLVTRCAFAQGASVFHPPVRGQVAAGFALPARGP